MEDVAPVLALRHDEGFSPAHPRLAAGHLHRGAPQRLIKLRHHVAAVRVKAEFAVRQMAAQIIVQHLNAEHAVQRAVLQHQRHGIGQPGGQVGLRAGAPAAVIARRQPVFRAIGHHERLSEIIAVSGAEVIARIPARVGRNVHRLDGRDRRTFQQKVAVLRRRAHRRVEVAHMETRFEFRVAIQIGGAENDVNAGNLVPVHRLDHIGADLADQLGRFLGAALQPIQRKLARIHGGLRLFIDARRQRADIRPLLGHLRFQIVGAVGHLLAEDGAFVAVHLIEDAAQIQKRQQNRRLQQDQNHQRLHHGMEDGFPRLRLALLQPRCTSVRRSHLVIARQARSIRP